MEISDYFAKLYLKKTGIFLEVFAFTHCHGMFLVDEIPALVLVFFLRLHGIILKQK